MATGPGFPSGNNTYVPPDISGRLRIGFSRDAKKFHLPKYVQYVETPHSIAYYLKITSQDAARIINTQDFEWPDGQPDRSSDQGTESFNFIPFTTKRNSYKFRLGDKSVKQAAWPIVEQHSQNKAAQCMTARTIRMLTTATTSSNWQQSADADNLSADHTSTASSLAGGLLDAGTSTTPYLKIALGAVADLINQDTLGVVDSELEGIYAAPSFSTLTMFWWQDEMTVEAKRDDWDRLTYGRVVEDTYEAVTSTASGYLITSATS